jgi:hypothetical protein
VVETAGVDLEAMSDAQPEGPYAGLVRIAAVPHKELRAFVASLRAEKGDA